MEALVTVSVSGHDVITGELMEIVPDSHVKVQYKKPRKSKPTREIFTWDRVVAVSGDEGEVGTLIVTSASVVLLSGSGEFDGVEGKNFSGTINDAPVIVNTEYATVSHSIDKVSEDEPKSKKTKKKKRKK